METTNGDPRDELLDDLRAANNRLRGLYFGAAGRLELCQEQLAAVERALTTALLSCKLTTAVCALGAMLQVAGMRNQQLPQLLQTGTFLVALSVIVRVVGLAWMTCSRRPRRKRC